MIDNKQHLQISSDLNNIYIIEEFIEKISDKFKINATYYGNLLIAITEAVENAIKYGNKNDIDKFVDIYFEYDNNGLKFTIKDQGNGFDYNIIPDPTIDLKAKGRGLYLIKMLSDELVFLDNGSTIEISFAIENINQQTAINRINELQNFGKKTATKNKVEEQDKEKRQKLK